MSRKNNSKLYQARHKAALERSKQSRGQSEARSLRRQHMRFLSKGLARLALPVDTPSCPAPTAGEATAAASYASSLSSSSLPAHAAASTSEGGGQKDGDKKKEQESAVGGEAAAVRELLKEENKEPHVKANAQDAESGSAQQGREEVRVRKSIWKGFRARGEADSKGSSRLFSSVPAASTAAKKKTKAKNKLTVLVSGKKDGGKRIVRTRNKKLLRQMQKRRK